MKKVLINEHRPLNQIIIIELIVMVRSVDEVTIMLTRISQQREIENITADLTLLQIAQAFGIDQAFLTALDINDSEQVITMDVCDEEG